jgi:hypothetical protein
MFGSTIANHIMMTYYATETSRVVTSPRLEASYAFALLDPPIRYVVGMSLV